jgi:hypothetical protein
MAADIYDESRLVGIGWQVQTDIQASKRWKMKVEDIYLLGIVVVFQFENNTAMFCDPIHNWQSVLPDHIRILADATGRISFN